MQTSSFHRRLSSRFGAHALSESHLLLVGRVVGPSPRCDYEEGNAGLRVPSLKPLKDFTIQSLGRSFLVPFPLTKNDSEAQ
jgi:hypothetical protein